MMDVTDWKTNRNTWMRVLFICFLACIRGQWITQKQLLKACWLFLAIENWFDPLARHPGELNLISLLPLKFIFHVHYSYFYGSQLSSILYFRNLLNISFFFLFSFLNWSSEFKFDKNWNLFFWNLFNYLVKL